MLPGVAFQAKVLLPIDISLEVGTVEIERYNAEKPKNIPMDEFVTFKARADPNNVFTCTLPDPGWWCMTASARLAKAQRQGKEYPVREWVTLWVHVDAKAR